MSDENIKTIQDFEMNIKKIKAQLETSEILLESQKNEILGYTGRALKESEVEQMVGLKKSRIRELEAAGQFPARRVFGTRSVRWLQSEIVDYINTRPKATL
jgi:Predicted transcriptional regulator